MSKKSKRMLKAFKIREEIGKETRLADAISKLRSYSSVKFDETLEIAITLNLNQKMKEQIYGTVDLPYGSGKSVCVAVITSRSKLEEAMKSGASIVGSDDLLAKIQDVKFNFNSFNKLVATPDMMPLISQLGRILGPRGIMPNPKLGTVSDDISGTVKRIMSGLVEYKSEKTGVVQGGVGKLSFTEDQLEANARAFIISVLKNSMVNIRTFNRKVRKIVLSSTMSPSIWISQDSVRSIFLSRE